jgi:hypothetical protein
MFANREHNGLPISGSDVDMYRYEDDEYQEMIEHV